MASLAINALVDDILTKQLRGYLAMGTEGDTKYSDIVVKDGNVHIPEMLLQPAAVNKVLHSRGIPAKVRCAYVEEVGIKLPWFHFATGFVEITIKELTVL